VRLLPFVAERIVNVSFLALRNVEGIPVVRSKLNALLYPEYKIGCADEIPSEHCNDIAILVLLNYPLRVLGLESTSNEQLARVVGQQGVELPDTRASTRWR
jgi:hypothetical protein